MTTEDRQQQPAPVDTAKPAYSRQQERILALAAVWQAATLVDQTARTGMCDSAALEASIDSVLQVDAPDAAGVFGGIDGVAPGLRYLLAHAHKRDPESLRLTRYVVSLLHLERRLSKRPEMADAIRNGIDSAQRQAQHFNSTHGAVIGALANIYEQTFSTLRYRIQVGGEQAHLSNPDTVNRVRALLLAGVRGAVLYRQRGGRVWSLLLQRRGIADTAQQLLQRHSSQ